MRNRREGLKGAARILVLGVVLVAAMVVVAVMFLVRAGQRPGMPALQASAKAGMAMVLTGLARFRLDCGRYPTQLEGLRALTVPPEGVAGWEGPYVKPDQILDPWGHPFVYTAPDPDATAGPKLMSYGADGRDGGEGENGDIRSE